MDITNLSEEDKRFLEKCEEEFKDRYTDNDEEYMKVYNRKPSDPPILENWNPDNNFGRRNNRYNRRPHPYNRYENRDRQERSDRNYRGYNDYNNYSYNRHRN